MDLELGLHVVAQVTWASVFPRNQLADERSKVELGNVTQSSLCSKFDIYKSALFFLLAILIKKHGLCTDNG